MILLIDSCDDEKIVVIDTVNFPEGTKVIRFDKNNSSHKNPIGGAISVVFFVIMIFYL